MANISVDARRKFDVSLAMPSASGSISVQVFGGPIARVFVGVFNEDDKALQGVGFGDFGPPLTTETGQASWLFGVTPDASYLKWGVQAVRSAGNLGSYSVTAKVRDALGNVLAAGQFSATIPDGQFQDDIIFDGVKFMQVAETVIPGGTNV